MTTRTRLPDTVKHRTRLPNGQYAKEQPRKDPRDEIVALRQIVRDIERKGNGKSWTIFCLERHIADRDETIRQLRSRVLGHSVAWFTIALLLASVGFLIFQYIVK